MLKRIIRRLKSFGGKARLLDYGEGNCCLSSRKNLKHCKVRFFGNNNRIEISDTAQIGALEIVFLGSNNFLKIGDEVQYSKGICWYASSGGSILIEAQTMITGADLTLTEPQMAITIGSRCLFAWGINIRCGDGHPIIDLVTGEKLNSARPIIIGNHVWIAAQATILKGVTIGQDSVIGAHSVVTKDVPANSIAAGIPAKVVRQSVT